MKLKWLTNNQFPNLVPDRYHELMRVVWEWRNLRARQHSGIAYLSSDNPIPKGGLAPFCPACPQPGINLLTDWQDDPLKWKYMRTLLGDGNFKQEHLKMKYPKDDIPLSDGHAYMVGKAGFEEYLAKIPEA
ncbi:hypothetical protein QCA50_011612 [Cerrena zonata]|uniref:Galactose-1-phosphate uridylyltransferase n=1 Tax=Cerrena zonata TaxID=2478898 RepID=A0AAW0G1M4_9APHY